MKLLIDLGNSRCKFAVLQEGASTEYGAREYTSIDKLDCVQSLCDQYAKAEKVILSSVLNEEINAAIRTALVEHDGRDVFYLQAAENSFGVQLAYEELGTIGVDRVAALISVNENYTGNSCVIDCGTAITIDAINQEGVHQGGVIFPGRETMKNALLSGTSINSAQAEEEFNLFATTTEAAVYTGCMSAVIGGIGYIVRNMTSEYGDFNQIVVTGGGAEEIKTDVLKSLRSMRLIFDANVILDGLKVIAKYV